MANTSAPSTAPRSERALRAGVWREGHSGEFPSTTCLDRSVDCSVTHHHLRCALASTWTPTTAHTTDMPRYFGERSRWNSVWNRAASRYFHEVLRTPATVRRCSGTIGLRSPPSLGSSFPPSTWTGSGLGAVSSSGCSNEVSRGTTRIGAGSGGGTSRGGVWPVI